MGRRGGASRKNNLLGRFERMLHPDFASWRSRKGHAKPEGYKDDRAADARDGDAGRRRRRPPSESESALSEQGRGTSTRAATTSSAATTAASQGGKKRQRKGRTGDHSSTDEHHNSIEDAQQVGAPGSDDHTENGSEDHKSAQTSGGGRLQADAAGNDEERQSIRNGKTINASYMYRDSQVEAVGSGSPVAHNVSHDISTCLQGVSVFDFPKLPVHRWGEYLAAVDKSVYGYCDFFEFPRNNGTLMVVFRGRMANVILQYLWVRIKADAMGWGLGVQNRQNQKGQAWTNPIAHYRNVVFEKLDSAPLIPPTAPEVGANCGPHYQHYNYIRNERCLSACLFSPRNDSLSERLFDMGPNDVVIHFREPIELMVPSLNRGNSTRDDTVPPFSYYYNILNEKRVKGQLGQIWIVRQHSKTGKYKSHKGTTHYKLLKEFGARVAVGESEQDHFLARNAPVFIGSFGTYTWTIAYLAGGREIHLPYDSRIAAGSTWNRWSDLFVDDDPRYVYHDCFVSNKSQTAQEVLAADTPFARAVRSKSAASATANCMPRKGGVLDYSYHVHHANAARDQSVTQS